MIIIISGKQGSGKSTFARKLADITFPQVAYFIDEIPQSRPPGPLPQLLITTLQEGQDIPPWIENRKDYTMLNVNRLRAILPIEPDSIPF